MAATDNVIGRSPVDWYRHPDQQQYLRELHAISHAINHYQSLIDCLNSTEKIFDALLQDPLSVTTLEKASVIRANMKQLLSKAQNFTITS